MDPMTIMSILGMAGKVMAGAGAPQPQMKTPPPPALAPITPGMGSNLGALLDPMSPMKPNTGFGYGGY